MVQFQYSFDPSLRPLYRGLSHLEFSDTQLDQGCSSLLYSARSPSPVYFSSNDLESIESCELFQRLTSVPQDAGMNRIYRRWSGESFPWRITSPSTLRRFDAALAVWREAHRGESPQSVDLVRFIYDWVFDSHGMGLSYLTGRAQSADGALRSGGGDCTEFTLIYLALLTRAGFSPFPVFVGEDNRGDRFLHLAAGVTTQGRILLLDPAYDPAKNRALPSQSNYDPLSPGHRSFAAIGFRELLAWYWNDRGSAEGGREGLQMLTRALQMDFYNPWIYANRGVVSFHEGDLTAARADFEQALRLHRENPQALAGLGDLHFREFEYPLAVDFYRRALQADPRSSVYREYLIRSLIFSRRRAEADREMALFPPSHPHSASLRSLLESF